MIIESSLFYNNIGSALFAIIAISWRFQEAIRVRRKKRRIGFRNNKRVEYTSPKGSYDVIIVGAGPAGSTAAYFLGKRGLRVALFDKKVFPRPKPCGDAWCAPALDILAEMGILSKLEEDGVIKSVTRGGLISPFGYECINNDGQEYGSCSGCRTYAIKRYIADEYLVRAAQKIDSVEVFEGIEVMDATLDKSSPDHIDVGLWKVTTRKSIDGQQSSTRLSSLASASNQQSYSATILLICDGSTSYLGQRLGIVAKGSQPEAVCSHAYVRGGTHNWHSSDGVMIFSRSMLPGYSALFRHYNDDVYFGTYVLPGGQATSRSIAPYETDAISRHPYIRDALGSHYKWQEKRIVAPIRLGGVPRSYGDQVLLVGDAAGHVDPLTGEGIHTAMIAGKIAAGAVHEMFRHSNFSKEASHAYELRCWDAFGQDFIVSAMLAKVIPLFPEAIDALAIVGKRKGQAFLDFFGEVMTGVRPKSDFLQPGLLLDLTLETIAQLLIQRVFRIEPIIPADLGRAAVQGTKK